MNAGDAVQVAYIGLGANLDDPEQQVLRALKALDQLPQTSLKQSSSLYRSKPVGPQDQPDYVNAVAELHTEMSPITLLDALQAIEQQHGRIRKRHWGERTLDLDILLIDQQQITSERLIVPHPFATQRSFVIRPLAEIAPDIIFPDGRTISQLLNAVPDDLSRIN